jgi:protein-L-isoaspartate(D-aspartate) O-methyltransferase
MSNDPFAAQRQAMVETQLMERGILDPAVLAAMRSVPREAFVPVDWRDYAYYDGPLPIAEGQTISQPYIVALMTQELLLTPHDRVLEVGTGSGYGAAVLSCIAAHVYTVERLHPLAVAARQRLQELGFHNVQVLAGNGTLGWPEHAPYDAIVVTAEGPSIPKALQAQLAVGGRLIIPVGDPNQQHLMRVVRHSETAFEQENLGAVRFVPLIGAQGWPDSPASGASERETES